MGIEKPFSSSISSDVNLEEKNTSSSINNNKKNPKETNNNNRKVFDGGGAWEMPEISTSFSTATATGIGTGTDTDNVPHYPDSHLPFSGFPPSSSSYHPLSSASVSSNPQLIDLFHRVEMDHIVKDILQQAIECRTTNPLQFLYGYVCACLEQNTSSIDIPQFPPNITLSSSRDSSSLSSKGGMNDDDSNSNPRFSSQQEIEAASASLLSAGISLGDEARKEKDKILSSVVSKEDSAGSGHNLQHDQDERDKQPETEKGINNNNNNTIMTTTTTTTTTNSNNHNNIFGLEPSGNGKKKGNEINNKRINNKTTQSGPLSPLMEAYKRLDALGCNYIKNNKFDFGNGKQKRESSYLIDNESSSLKQIELLDSTTTHIERLQQQQQQQQQKNGLNSSSRHFDGSRFQSHLFDIFSFLEKSKVTIPWVTKQELILLVIALSSNLPNTNLQIIEATHYSDSCNMEENTEGQKGEEIKEMKNNSQLEVNLLNEQDHLNYNINLVNQYGHKKIYEFLYNHASSSYFNNPINFDTNETSSSGGNGPGPVGKGKDKDNKEWKGVSNNSSNNNTNENENTNTKKSGGKTINNVVNVHSISDTAPVSMKELKGKKQNSNSLFLPSIYLCPLLNIIVTDPGILSAFYSSKVCMKLNSTFSFLDNDSTSSDFLSNQNEIENRSRYPKHALMDALKAGRYEKLRAEVSWEQFMLSIKITLIYREIMNLWAEVFILNGHLCKIDEYVFADLHFSKTQKNNKNDIKEKTSAFRDKCAEEEYRQIPVHYLKMPLDVFIRILLNYEEEEKTKQDTIISSYQRTTEIDGEDQVKVGRQKGKQLSELLYALSLTSNAFQARLLKIVTLKKSYKDVYQLQEHKIDRAYIEEEGDYVSLYDVACAIVCQLTSIYQFSPV